MDCLLKLAASKQRRLFFLTGNFRFNRGEISSRRPLQDNEYVLTRYVFSDITDTTYRWQGYNSLDYGKTWNSNWIMENFRISEIPELPNANEKFYSYEDDSFSTTEENKRFHAWEGTWTGEIADSTEEGWISEPVAVTFWKVQNGISMFYELESDSGFEEVGLLTYRARNNIWLSLRLDNKNDSEMITKFWKAEGDTIKFSEYSQLYKKKTTEIDNYIYADNELNISRSVSYDETDEVVSRQIILLKRN